MQTEFNYRKSIIYQNSSYSAQISRISEGPIQFHVGDFSPKIPGIDFLIFHYDKKEKSLIPDLTTPIEINDLLLKSIEQIKETFPEDFVN